jgi:hypothetical protein
MTTTTISAVIATMTQDGSSLEERDITLSERGVIRVMKTVRETWKRRRILLRGRAIMDSLVCNVGVPEALR